MPDKEETTGTTAPAESGSAEVTPDTEEAQGAAQGDKEQDAAADAVPTSTLSEAIGAMQRARTKSRDHLLRVAAEFENYKKRSRKEQRDKAKHAENSVVLDFLPIVDNLERALEHAGETDIGLAEGVRMVRKQFLSLLEKYQIKPFKSLGEPFDPEFHEAVQQIASDQPANHVCQELLKGYIRGEKLVRPAMVVVSTGQAGAEPSGEPLDGEESIGGGDAEAEEQ